MSHPPNVEQTGGGVPAAVRRTSVLAAMAIGAAIGLVGGQALESAVGGADPAFAGAIGGALGAALGRSSWLRISNARARRHSVALALGVLAGRIIGCGLIGLALVASLQGARASAVPMTSAQRMTGLLVGIALLVGTAIVEQRWMRARRVPIVIDGAQHGR